MKKHFYRLIKPLSDSIFIVLLHMNKPQCRLPRWLSCKEYACQCRRHKRHGLDPWVGKIPWRRKGEPTPVFLPGKFCGQKVLAGVQHMGLQRVGHDLAAKQQTTAQRGEMPYPKLHSSECSECKISVSESLCVSPAVNSFVFPVCCGFVVVIFLSGRNLRIIFLIFT